LVPTPTVSNCTTKQPQSQHCPPQAADGFKKLETAIIPSVETDLILIPRTEFDLSLRLNELSDAEFIAFHGNNPYCMFANSSEILFLVNTLSMMHFTKSTTSSTISLKDFVRLLLAAPINHLK
jgi:hypothetical protein